MQEEIAASGVYCCLFKRLFGIFLGSNLHLRQRTFTQASSSTSFHLETSTRKIFIAGNLDFIELGNRFSAVVCNFHSMNILSVEKEVISLAEADLWDRPSGVTKTAIMDGITLDHIRN